MIASQARCEGTVMFGRPKFNVDDIAVAAPCPVSWESMESIEDHESDLPP